MYNITMDDPAYPKGAVLIVKDFPVSLENGKTVKVSEEDVKAYEDLTGNDFETVASGIVGAEVKHTGAKKKDGE